MHYSAFLLLIGGIAVLSACNDNRQGSSHKPYSPSDGGQPANSSRSNSTSEPENDRAPRGDTSFLPVDSKEEFEQLYARLSSTKDEVMATQKNLLENRYDLSDNRLPNYTMTRGKSIQGGVRVKLKEGISWDKLASMSSDEIRESGLFPEGFKPLPHARSSEGGQVIPKQHIEEILEQENRDLNRFDVEYDLPEHFTPEFPPPLFLTSRPDLGDVSQGELITNQNFWRLFDGILTPRQLDGLRLLVTPFVQQQFNLTFDRRVMEPSLGITCFDCHANGHTNAAFHLDPVTRPQESRRRLDTPSLRGVNIQRLFGSQRAIKTVEDFTEFEQRGAYFDGDHVIANKKGINILERGSQVAHMAEFQALIDFPPAPKLTFEGKLDPLLASDAELRGEKLFFGKARCASCHTPPYYTDNLMHDLGAHRFYKPQMINGRYASNDGPIKTFPLRGIKESPPYLHDGRLLTLADTVEFFNLVLELKLTKEEKEDLVTFMLAL